MDIRRTPESIAATIRHMQENQAAKIARKMESSGALNDGRANMYSRGRKKAISFSLPYVSADFLSDFGESLYLAFGQCDKLAGAPFFTIRADANTPRAIYQFLADWIRDATGCKNLIVIRMPNGKTQTF